MAISSVTERVCWVQLLAIQKSINRPGWWKGKFALFQMPATCGVRRADVYPKADGPPPETSEARASIDKRKGLHGEIAQSTLTVIFRLVISDLTRAILIV